MPGNAVCLLSAISLSSVSDVASSALHVLSDASLHQTLSDKVKDIGVVFLMDAFLVIRYAAKVLSADHTHSACWMICLVWQLVFLVICNVAQSGAPCRSARARLWRPPVPSSWRRTVLWTQINGQM